MENNGVLEVQTQEKREASMFKRCLMALLVIVSFLLTATPSHAWFIYYKPAFHGKVIDAETRKPIEGAVVVVEYFKKTAGPFESMSSVTGVKETLTDKNGEFYIPRYFKIVGPLSWSAVAKFIIYKPGYASFPGDILGEKYQVSTPLKQNMPWDAIEEYFSRPLGKVGEIMWSIGKATVTFGVVELPELKTKEERLKAIPGGPTGYRAKDLPLFFKEVNEEYRRFGLGEIN